MSVFAESFLYELDQKTQVATITLNRPERLNALTFAVYKELRDAFQGLDTEPGVRAIIITGAGRAFCSGGDVEDIIGALLGRDLEALKHFTRLTCGLILAMREQFFPITKMIYQLLGRIDPNSPSVACALGVVGMVILTTSLLVAGKILGKKMGQLFRA